MEMALGHSQPYPLTRKLQIYRFRLSIGIDQFEFNQDKITFSIFFSGSVTDEEKCTQPKCDNALSKRNEMEFFFYKSIVKLNNHLSKSFQCNSCAYRTFNPFVYTFRIIYFRYFVAEIPCRKSSYKSCISGLFARQ